MDHQTVQQSTTNHSPPSLGTKTNLHTQPPSSFRTTKTPHTTTNDLPDLGQNKKAAEQESDEDRSDWYILEKITKSRLMGNQLHFKIEWRNCNKCAWEPTENVPGELISFRAYNI